MGKEITNLLLIEFVVGLEGIHMAGILCGGGRYESAGFYSKY